jgi:hypothetical protein
MTAGRKAVVWGVTRVAATPRRAGPAGGFVPLPSGSRGAFTDPAAQTWRLSPPTVPLAVSKAAIQLALSAPMTRGGRRSAGTSPPLAGRGSDPVRQPEANPGRSITETVER